MKLKIKSKNYEGMREFWNFPSIFLLERLNVLSQEAKTYVQQFL